MAPPTGPVAPAAPAMAPPTGPPLPPPHPDPAPPTPPPTAAPVAMAPPTGPAFPPAAAAEPTVPAVAPGELPPPDPATWSQHPLGPVVWGTEPPPTAPQTPDAAPAVTSGAETVATEVPGEAASPETYATAAAPPVAATETPPAGPPVAPPGEMSPTAAPYLAAPPPTGPAYPAAVSAAETGDAAETEDGEKRNSSLRVILIVGAILILAALVAFAAFVTPGFLSSAQATDEAPAVAAPATAAGLTKADEVASAPATVFRDMAAATSAEAGAQYATYTGDAVSTTVFVSPVFGGSPQSMAQAYESAGGSVGSLTTVAAGPRGGTMACGAVNKKQSVCFWTSDGVRGAADVAGMTPEAAGALAGKMRVALEPTPTA